MVGFAPKTINKNGSNYNQCGYYFYLSNGYKYAQGGICQQFSNGSHYQQNSIIGMKYNRKKGEISVYKDKQNLGVAFSSLKKLDLFPSLDFNTNNASIEFVKPKFK